MKISVNLATHPYVELRPVYTRLRTWMAILALTGLALWFMYRSEHAQAQEAQARVAEVQHRVQQLEAEQQSYKEMMAEPHNAGILKQADYLNGLFRRKAFSWTATMEDLENVLPSGVQVLSIDPIIAKDGHVTIHLRVTGARDRALDLIRNLEQSKHFAAPRLEAETLANTDTGSGRQVAQPISDTNQVNFDILADYRPLPVAAGKPDQEAPAGKPDETRKKKAAGKKAPQRKSPERRQQRRKIGKPSAARPAQGGRR
jgi:type IV pilus assembly protein PilN